MISDVKQDIDERLGVRYLSGPPERRVLFTFVTLLARQDNYDRFLRSAETAGFSTANSEFLALDNRTGNRFDGFDAIRSIVTMARGQYIVFTHDDVEFLSDGATELESRLAELENHDPKWLVAGNAGGVGYRAFALHITDKSDTVIDRYRQSRHGADSPVTGPVLVESLDENFFIIRSDRPVMNSYDLSGFHFYAADLCRLAEISGGRSYVIPFLLKHHSDGNIDSKFLDCQQRFANKYRRYFMLRRLQLPSARFKFALSGMRDAWRETAQKRWNFLNSNVYASNNSKLSAQPQARK